MIEQVKKVFRQPPAMTEETHRATAFEIFFDLVFAFAITRVISFMTHSLTALTLAQGLLLLVLLWWSWTAYSWLGNQARADRGLIQAGMLVAMAALFVAALVMPDAWGRGTGTLNGPLTLALAFTVVRVVYLALYLYAADDRRLRLQLLLDTIPQSLAWIALISGALLGETAQTALWALAFVIDFGGGRITSSFSGWKLRSPSHFAERFGLVLTIALGESLASVGAGAGFSVTSGRALVAASIGFVTAVCLWWLYFVRVASAAGRALAQAPDTRRAEIARDAYTLAHFPLIAGIIYIALGIRETLAHVTGTSSPPGGTSLGWAGVAALYGGVVLYLCGRTLFVRLTVRSTPAAPLITAGATLLLLPATLHIPALAALGLVSALLIGLVGYERLSSRKREQG